MGEIDSSQVEERKNFLVNDQEPYKEIRQRLRSGAHVQRGPTPNSDAKSIADQHAKRLRVAKSSRLTIGGISQDGGSSVKPPRFGRGARASAPEAEIDLTLSNAAGRGAADPMIDEYSGQKQA